MTATSWSRLLAAGFIAATCYLYLPNAIASTASSGLVPAVNSRLYYQIGGGNDVPLPAFYDTHYIPLHADGQVGLGFNCGAFNPVASIRNSLNEIKQSALNVERQVLNDATAAVTEFPLYELSRADPNLYNLMVNAMADARQDVAVSTKSCEVMQSAIAAGENPYAHWGQIALGNRWQQEIGMAESSGNGDINQARQAVAQSAGKSGVPWVDSDSAASTSGVHTRLAGGEHQPPIRVIADTAMGGYAVIVNGSAAMVSHSPLAGEAPSELTNIFPTAKAAADWITKVVGEKTITTYNDGEKSAQPGIGLYADIQTQTQQLLPKLTALISGSTPLTVENLQAISPEGMALSPEVIEDIRHQPKVVQGIVANKLAQNMAALQVINQARLAMDILRAGSRIPAIDSNQAAQQTIKAAIARMQQDVQAILTFVHARQTLMSNMLSTLVQAGVAERAKNTAIAMPKPNAPWMENGAIAKETPSSP